jgi:hypothetical protein
MVSESSEDALIVRLRARIADPGRRVDSRPSELWASATSQGLGGLLSMGRALADDLRRLRTSGPNDELVARAGRLERAMNTPAERPLPPPATPDQLAAAEGRLGVRLPPLLRRLLLELANGGFGPGPGILGVTGGWTTDHGKAIEDLHAQMLDATTENPRWIWPPALVPLVDLSGVFACTDASTPAGRMIEFDFEELDEGGPDAGWSRAFTEVAPSLEAWLDAWLEAPSADERLAALRATPYSPVPEETRVYWASMTTEERAAYGLPEVGWGRALFGDAWGDDPRDGSAG